MQKYNAAILTVTLYLLSGTSITFAKQEPNFSAVETSHHTIEITFSGVIRRQDVKEISHYKLQQMGTHTLHITTVRIFDIHTLELSVEEDMGDADTPNNTFQVSINNLRMRGGRFLTELVIFGAYNPRY